jgi:hypothetical protein
VIAAALATPVAEFLPPDGMDARVLGSSRTAVYVDCGFVLAITARDVPAMPDGVVLSSSSIAGPPPRGSHARVSRARIELTGMSIDLGRARDWRPDVVANLGRDAGEVSRRGRGILRNCRVSPATEVDALLRSLVAASGLKVIAEDGGRAGVETLLEALRYRDRDRAARAARALLGRGGGLTPEADDLIGAAVAGTLAFGAACGFTGRARAEFVDALVPGDLRVRTNSLSATLVELAATGRVVEPVQHIVDLSLPPERWRNHLRRLVTIGHSTGRAWAIGCGATALLLAEGSREKA